MSRDNEDMKGTICWNCKKARGEQCPWIAKCQPVEGWEANKTDNTYNVEIVDPKANPVIQLKKVHSYQVTKCPLFERAYTYFDYNDIAEEVSERLGYKDTSSFYRSPIRMLKRYEKSFEVQTAQGTIVNTIPEDKKIPEWAWFRALEGSLHTSGGR